MAMAPSRIRRYIRQGRLSHLAVFEASVRLGCFSRAVSSCTGRLAASYVARFARRHPSLEVQLHIHNRDALLERMRGDEDDLYLFATPPEDGVVSQRILPYQLEVLAAADHRLARSRSIAFATIAVEPFVMRERGSGTRRVVEALYRERGFAPRVRLELPTSEGVEEAVSAGVGITILPQLDDGEGRRGLVALDVEGFPLPRHLSLSYPVGKALAPAARAFL